MALLQKIKMYYDPLGRVVKTVNPDNSEQRVVYGTPTALNTPSNVTPSPWVNYSYGMNGKEKDDEIVGSGNSYDYGARQYDPRLGRWWSIDPLAIKYADLTPYHFCDNSPIRIKDDDGRDIIILSAPKGAGGYGHAAVLIGNDKDGWKLYSKNGTLSSGGSSGRSDKNPQINVPFETLKEFGNTENFTEQGDIEYTSAFRITTDKATDEKMKRAAAKSVGSDYDVLNSSCIDVCSDALKAGGLDEGYKEVTTVNDPDFGSGTIKAKSRIPNERYEEIKNNNTGVDATKSITPDAKVATQKKADYTKKESAKQAAKQAKENKLQDSGPKY
ncbi:MAG: RHS repeat-associated core domain-containing protein [Bacteroidota bacterium]|nr:RHS repeat-associated core domain-containing protein [Bacteroidota bacterium]